MIRVIFLCSLLPILFSLGCVQKNKEAHKQGDRKVASEWYGIEHRPAPLRRAFRRCQGDFGEGSHVPPYLSKCRMVTRGYSGCREDHYSREFCLSAQAQYSYCRSLHYSAELCRGAGVYFKSCIEDGYSVEVCLGGPDALAQ